MNEGDKKMGIRRKKQVHGAGYVNLHAYVESYLMALLTQEADEKNQTVARVLNYLLLCGFKAHAGTFRKPSKNTILENYRKRGNKWTF
jgi:methyl coenzyme M reductase subunit D